MWDGRDKTLGAMTLKEKSCCFTGHRQLPPGEEAVLADKLAVQIGTLAGHGVEQFYCGGALGFDTLAATSVLKARKLLPKLKLILLLPCRTQAKYYNKYQKQLYQHILSNADGVTYISDAYTAWCMYERNRSLVDQSAYCICYLRRRSGGTNYTVQYARRRGLKIIYL